MILISIGIVDAKIGPCWRNKDFGGMVSPLSDLPDKIAADVAIICETPNIHFKMVVAVIFCTCYATVRLLQN